MTAPAELPRTAADTRRSTEATKHFAQMVEHVGRSLAALEAGRWDSARDHLFLVREASAICDAFLNSGHPAPAAFLAAVRDQVPQEWAQTIRSVFPAAEQHGDAR